METIYKTKGTCSMQIKVDVEDEIIKSVSFVGGCNGNLQGVSRLVEGMKARDAISKLRGIKCGYKNTSCPDQLTYALEAALSSSN
ncbi:MAG: TIGR03905 family TSCPD domain-containing protein [Butyrivibrio sp.]|nr:TIGR03905 family TSCPD domain-containing protein [Butyrivibrio sp.]